MHPNEQGGKSVKKKKRTLPFVLAILFIAALLSAAFVRHCVIGDERCTGVAVGSVEVTDDSVRVSGEVSGFCAVKDCSWELSEDTLVIRLVCTWPVLHTDKTFSVEADGDFASLCEIDVADSRNALVVWERE